MSEKMFHDTATESELRDFAAKVFNQCQKIRKAEVKYDAANTAEKEAKETLKRLNDEKNSLIEEMDEEPKAEQARAIKDKRFEELHAELDADEKRSIKKEAKHSFAKEESILREMIDESNDQQQRIDFDKANRSNVAVEMPPEKSGGEVEEVPVKQWRDISIDELDIPKGMKTPLKEIGIDDFGQLQLLCFGDLDGYEKGLASIPGWDVGRVQKLSKAIEKYTEENGIDDFVSSPVAEPAEEQYDDADDIEEVVI